MIHLLTPAPFLLATTMCSLSSTTNLGKVQLKLTVVLKHTKYSLCREIIRYCQGRLEQGILQ